jgi:hypothetical protein
LVQPLCFPDAASCVFQWRFPRHSAHVGQELEIHYRWHPLYGRRVRYRDSEQRGPGGVAGYVGQTDEIDEALTKFSFAYAEQNEEDYAELRKAAREQRIEVAETA